jgi:uncharacterized membrane protein
MNRQRLDWLVAEIGVWEKEGVIDAATAVRIRERCAATSSEAPRSAALAPRSAAFVAFSIVGALLVGLGVILLIAHNWGELSRPVRTLIAFAPLVIAQLAAWAAVRRGAAGASWREAAATFWSLAIGATIALVAQTYHLPGDMSRFLLVWALLGLPVIYLLDSAVSAAFYSIGITTWVAYAGLHHHNPSFYWLLLAGVMPWLLRRIRYLPEAAGTVFAHVCIVLGFLVSIGFATGTVFESSGLLVYLGACATLYAIDAARAFPRRALQRPGALLGALGLLGLSLALTFDNAWRGVGFPAGAHDLPADVIPAAACLVMIVLPLVLTLLHRQRWAPHQVLLALTPLAVIVLSSAHDDLPVALLFNAFPLAVGVVALWNGARTESMGTINMGMLFIGALVAVRFFDSELSFTLRGIVFVLLGAGFLVTNIVMARRQGGRREAR